MKTKALIVVALMLGGCATVSQEDVTLSPKVRAACDEEGGCSLFTLKALGQRMEEAFTAGFLSGAAATEKKRGSL